SLQFTANGAVKDLLNLSGMDLHSRLTGKDLAEFGVVIQEELPATDEFEIQGRLIGSTDVLGLKGARGNARRGSLQFTANGAVKDLLTLRGMDLNSSLKGKNLEEFGEIIGEKLPATDQFEIQGLLTGSTNVLALQEGHVSASLGSMRLTLTGAVKDLLTLGGIDLQSRLNGSELAEIGLMFGSDLPQLGPFDVIAKLSGSSEAISLDPFSAMVEKSDFKGLAKVEFLKRPKITAHLESSVIDFTTLMKSFEKNQQKPADKAKQKSRLFSDAPLPLDLLKKMDADIVLKARNIHAKDARLNFGHMIVKLEEHDFSIDKLEATYNETKISGNLQISAGAPTQVATHFLVQDFNLGDFLKETGKSDQVRAIIDIAAHGKSRGDSVHRLMANLDGAIGVVMGEGYLTKYLDMLSSGLTQKVFQIWKPHKAVDQIKCAAVQFDIKAGVAASKTFIFDTQAGILAGEGNINLGTEKINFILVPKPAHPDLSILTNLRVSGSVIDPHVGVDKSSTLTQSAKALSFLAVGPLGLLAPFVHLGANKSHPCNVPSIGQLGLKAPASD
ncbi:MAG: AsmA-like C-terminal region-containing protein, partial [Desulfobacterales bacterium]